MTLTLSHPRPFCWTASVVHGNLTLVTQTYMTRRGAIREAHRLVRIFCS